MTTELVPTTERELGEYVEVTERGLLFHENGGMPIEMYGTLCETLGAVSDAVRWGVGDALNYGERTYGDRYLQYADLLHCSVWTLRARARVSAAIPYEERRPNCWTAFQITAHLEPENRAPLIEAYADGLVTTDDLRDQVRALKAGPDATLLPPCPKCGGQLSSRHCKDCGMDFSQAVWWLHDLLKAGEGDDA